MFPQGTIYAGYEILSGPHSGSFGHVYKALHHTTKQPVALKFSRFPGDANWYQRFKNENTILHKLKPHQNVVLPHSHVTHDGSNAFYAMEFLELDLDIVLTQLPSAKINERLDLFKQICTGLSHAHSKDIFHRDLNPGNVRFSSGSHMSAKLTDFGFSKLTMNTFKSTIPLQMWGNGVRPPEVAFLVTDNPTNEQYVRGDVYAIGILFNIMFSASIVPYVLSIQSDIENYKHNVGIYNPADYLQLDEHSRSNHYENWLQQLNVQNNLAIYLPDVNLAKKLTRIARKMCDPDYRLRYSTVDEVINEVERL